MWSHDGLVCTGETYKNVVVMAFSSGASLKNLRVSSTQALKVMPGVPLTFTRALNLVEVPLCRRDGIKNDCSVS